MPKLRRDDLFKTHPQKTMNVKEIDCLICNRATSCPSCGSILKSRLTHYRNIYRESGETQEHVKHQVCPNRKCHLFGFDYCSINYSPITPSLFKLEDLARILAEKEAEGAQSLSLEELIRNFSRRS